MIRIRKIVSHETVTEKDKMCKHLVFFCCYILGASIPAAAHSSLQGHIRQGLLSQLASLIPSFVRGGDFDD